MRPISSLLLRAIVVLVVVVASLPAQGAASAGTIVGRVILGSDSSSASGLSPRGRPGIGARVSVNGTTLGAVGGASGRFVISGVAVGPHTLRIRAIGYRTVERPVDVPAADTARLEVTLEPDPLVLGEVKIAARSVDQELFETRPSVGTIALSAAAMAAAPRVGERDVVRVIQLLPGVEARNDFNTGLNVRGGEADQNLILLDGHPLYNPFHLGGLFSTFMDATVGGIELMTGAFPARYGGRLSSVLDVKSADDSRPGIHGTADISALGATGRVTGLFADGLGTWSVAARRTYADAATRIFTNNIFPYHFRDLHARSTYILPADVRVALTLYLGRDILDANLAEFETDSAVSRASEGRWAFNWGNRLAGLTLTKDLGRATFEQRLSSSAFSTNLDLGDGALAQRNSISDLRASGSLLTRTEDHDLGVGYELATHRIRYSSGSAQTGTENFDIAQHPSSGSLWVDDLWRASPRWLVEGGVRADGLTSRQWMAISPRLSLKYFVTPSLALTAAGGHVTQWLNSFAGDGPLRYFEIWIASDSLIPTAAAWHGVVGAERRLREVGSIRVEGYLKRYDRVMEANWSEDPMVRGDEFFAAQGTSYGVDLLARWQPSHGVAGWVSYSYGLSSRWRDTLRWFPGHDRRHDVNVVATWRLSRFQFGTRFGFATGTPYTPIIGGLARRVYDPSTDRWGTGSPLIFIESIGGGRNRARFPATHRIDVDVSRDFRIRKVLASTYVSVANAYNARNVFVYLYQYSTDPPTRRAISQFPVLPSAGVRLAF